MITNPKNNFKTTTKISTRQLTLTCTLTHVHMHVDAYQPRSAVYVSCLFCIHILKIKLCYKLFIIKCLRFRMFLLQKKQKLIFRVVTPTRHEIFQNCWAAGHQAEVACRGRGHVHWPLRLSNCIGQI